jgi:hypothetical protein
MQRPRWYEPVTSLLRPETACVGQNGTITVWNTVCFAMRALQALRDQENFTDRLMIQESRSGAPWQALARGENENKAISARLAPVELVWVCEGVWDAYTGRFLGAAPGHGLDAKNTII